MWVRASCVTCAWAAICPASVALMCRTAVSLEACWLLASAISRFAPHAKSVTDRLGPVSPELRRRLVDWVDDYEHGTSGGSEAEFVAEGHELARLLSEEMGWHVAYSE